jgi:hypothetical protein
MQRDLHLPAPRRAAELLSAALIASAIAIVASTLFVVLRTHHPLPVQEEWMNIIVFKSWLAGGTPLQDLFSQHSEHRIFFPRLVMFADYLWFDGGGYFSLAAIFCCLFSLTALFLFLLRRLGPRDAGAVGIAATVFALIFSLSQWENFRSAIQVYFVGALAAACCAIVLFNMALQRTREGRPAATWIAGALFLVAVATFSMASGMLAGFILTLSASCARMPRHAIVAFLATAGIAGVYFFHFHLPDAAELYSAFGPPPKDPSQPAWLEAPIGFLVFPLAYLGNLFDPWLAGAVALGAVGVVLVGADLWRFVTCRDESPERRALLGVTLFAGGSAFLTGVGRLPYEGLDAALSSRYSLASACFWSALLISGWSRTDALQHARKGALALGCVVLTGAALLAQAPGAAVLKDQAFLQNVMEDALLQDLFDAKFVEASYTKPDWPRTLTPLLKARGMSIFSSSEARLYRAPLSEAGEIDAARCPGSFDAAISDHTLGPGGVRVTGVAEVESAALSVLRLYLVDASGTIVGFASRPSDDPAWMGYATAPLETELSAYARRTSGRLCRLGTQKVSSANATDAH